MKCSYCGEEIREQWKFCMNCGTSVEAVNEFEQEVPGSEISAVEPVAFSAPVADEADFYQPEVQTSEIPEAQPEVPLGRKITIDPEKFEFHPEQRDDPIPKGVSSWELVPAEPVAPKLLLPAKRSLCKMIFLGLLTLGIYPMVIYSKIITELNIAASRHDGKRTMTFYGMLMVAPLTLGVYAFVWFHNLCARIGDELQRRCIDYKFGPSHFWLWNILGSFILVGPFIFLHKLMKSMNFINQDFNEKG